MYKIADHKIVELNIDIENQNIWGKYYWKINKGYFNDSYYRNQISNIRMDPYFEDIINFWETAKTKIKSFSKSYASTQSLIRKRQEDFCKTNINSIHDPQIQNIFQNKLKEINDFKNNEILTRTKNKTLNNIYAQGKEIT